jgi:hypothetical protein
MAGGLSAIIVLATIGAINWFSLQARWARPRNRDGYTEYPVPAALRLLLSIAISCLIYGSIANFLNRGSERWVSLLLIGLALFCLYFTPPTIVCSREQLVSIKWYGIKKITMNWSEVISVYLNPQDNSITVRDKLGHTIVHTNYNVGRPQFIEQVAGLPYGFARMM